MTDHTTVDPATFPMEDLRSLMTNFFPPSTQRDVLQLASEIHLWFHEDRHFDVVEGFEQLFDRLTSEPAVSALEGASVAQESEEGDKATTAADAAATPAVTPLAVSVVIERLKDCPAYVTAAKKVAACQALADDVTNHATWAATKVDEKGYGTYYRAEEGRTAHSFKVIGEVQQSILHMASVIMELDLYTQWFPFCCEAQMQGEVTRFHKSSRFAIQMPWPMSNREVFLVGYGVDDLQKRKRIIIWSKSVGDDEVLPPQIERPPVKKGNTRISVDFGGFVIDALSPTTCRVSFIMNVDPQIPAVPTTLVNWVSRKMIWVLLWQMGNAAKEAAKSKGKYAERRTSRPDIYLHFRERAKIVFNLHFPGEELPEISV